MGKDQGKMWHATSMKRQMKCSVSSWQNSNNCWSLFSWGTSTYLTFTGNRIQQRGNSLGCSLTQEQELGDTAGKRKYLMSDKQKEWWDIV